MELYILKVWQYSDQVLPSTLTRILSDSCSLSVEDHALTELHNAYWFPMHTVWITTGFLGELKKKLVFFSMTVPIMSKIIHPLCYFHDPTVYIYLFFSLFVNGKFGPWTKCLNFKTCKYSWCVKIIPFPAMIKTHFFHFSH